MIEPGMKRSERRLELSGKLDLFFLLVVSTGRGGCYLLNDTGL